MCILSLGMLIGNLNLEPWTLGIGSYTAGSCRRRDGRQ